MRKKETGADRRGMLDSERRKGGGLGWRGRERKKQTGTKRNMELGRKKENGLKEKDFGPKENPELN